MSAEGWLNQAWFGVDLPGGPRPRAERVADYLKLLELEALRVKDPELARFLVELRGFYRGLCESSGRLPRSSLLVSVR